LIKGKTGVILNDLEKNFFSEVDQKRHSTKVPWIGLFVFLIVIFILSVIALVKIRGAFSDLNFDLWNFDYQLPKITLSEKILSASKVDNQNSFSIPINSTELSAYFNLADDNFPLKNTYAKIKSDTVVVYGQLKNNHLGLPISMILTAGVENGLLVFSSRPTEMETIIIPEETRLKTAEEINKRIKFDLNLCQGFKVLSADQVDDQITINMKKVSDESTINN
jgi:hypothetical protein